MAGGPAVRLYRAQWSTNCERVGLALAHKGIEAQSVLIEYSNRRPVEAISGQPLVPVIEDAGEVVADSVEIMRHLDRRTPEPPLFPADPDARAAVEVFIGWFENVYKAAPNAIEDELGGGVPDRARIERLGAEMAERLDVFEGLLSGGGYMAGGELSAADFVAYPFLKYAAGRDPADDETFHVVLSEHQTLGDTHPALRAWIERIAALPSAYPAP
ncbi:MAG: glutathione S-transferase family protein [Solirubrobacterales bacterium]